MNGAIEELERMGARLTFAGDQPLSLDIAGLGLDRVPEEIRSLDSIEVLSLGRNEFDSLPSWLGNFRSLKRLDVERNRLQELPAWIDELAALEQMLAGRNYIRELPQSLGNLSELTLLNLRNNSIYALPDSIVDLASLVELDVSENDLTRLPAQLGNLRKLRNLYVSGNNIEALPESIGELSSLESLAISSNQIVALPDSFAGLFSLHDFWGYGNPMLYPPRSIVDQGLSAIRAYLRATLDGSRPDERIARVLIVGPPAVGKSSLLARLVSGEFQEGPRNETPDIDTASRHIDDAALDLRLWDFGGQYHLHAAHRLFIDSGTTFLLVLDALTTREASYWLNMIETAASDPRIWMVENKSDLTAATLDFHSIALRHPSVVGFQVASAKTGEGLDELEGKLEQLALDAPHPILPLSWVTVRNSLAGMRDVFVSIDQFAGVCDSSGVVETEDQEAVLRYLGSTGDVLALDRLSPRVVVLKIDWLVKALYRVIASDAAQSSGGILHAEVARQLILQRTPAATSLIDHVLSAYGFVIRQPGHVIIPDLLPPSSEYRLEVVPIELSQRVFSFQIDVSYLVARLLPMLADDLVPEFMWRHGARLFNSATGAEGWISALREENQLLIRTWGPGRTDYLSHLRVLTLGAAADAGDSEPREQVAIPGHEGQFVDYDEAIGQYLMGEKTMTVGRLAIKIDLREVLWGVEAPTRRKAMTGNGPTYNFNQSAVTFGSGNATTFNASEARRLGAELSDELEKMDSEQAKVLAAELREATLDGDRPRIAKVAKKALKIAGIAAPVTALAHSILQLVLATS